MSPLSPAVWRHRLPLLCLGVLALYLLSSCARSPALPTPAPIPLRGAGSTLIAPLWPKLAADFNAASAAAARLSLRPEPSSRAQAEGLRPRGARDEAHQPDYLLSFTPLPSSLALDELAAGRWDFAFSADPAALARYSDLSFTPIAPDALAIVVHPNITLSHLTLTQTRDLFGGYVQDWSAFGQPSGPVQLIGREEGSDAANTFASRVMGEHPIARTLLLKPDDAVIVAYIAAHPGAIGYASVRAIGDAEVRIVAIEDSLPDQPGYPLARTIDFVLPPSPSPAALTLRDFLLSDAAQARLNPR